MRLVGDKPQQDEVRVLPIHAMPAQGNGEVRGREGRTGHGFETISMRGIVAHGGQAQWLCCRAKAPCLSVPLGGDLILLASAHSVCSHG